MAKIQLPMVGAQVSTKEMLILIGLIGITAWWIKRKITQNVVAVADKMVDTVKPVFTKPGEIVYELFHPVTNPEKDIYHVSIADRIAVNKQILEAQRGGYTHRADFIH